MFKALPAFWTNPVACPAEKECVDIERRYMIAAIDCRPEFFAVPPENELGFQRTTDTLRNFVGK